jgi:peroxiredoxin Q/BCP
MVKQKSKINNGEVAPNFVATSTAGEIKLSDLKGKNIILYFYPKDDTPGCTIEAQDFSKKAQDFDKLDSIIIGVSKDNIASHEKFISKYSLNFDLIADEDKSLCQLYQVIKEKSMFGKKYQGIERSTFLIDRLGKVVKVWRNVKVKGHVDEVYLELKNSL